MKVFSQFAPVFPQLLPQPGKCVTPWPGTKEGIEVKTSARHAGNAGRQCDESTNYGQKPRQENRQISPTGEKVVRPVQFTAAQQNPAPVFFHQRAPAITSNFVGYERPDIAADGS